MPNAILVFIFGSLVGSFLNVCIHRLPKEESVILPRSYCPKCTKKIPWHDNIPLISYILLRGRCRFCREKISFTYFLVELLSASAFLGFYLAFGVSLKFTIYTAVTCALIVITFIDFRHQIIPDEITIPGIVLGVLLSAVFPSLHESPRRLLSLGQSLLGALAGGGTLYAVGVIGKWIFKKEAMGGGDVKLMAMFGAFFGWKLALLTIFLSSLLGSVAGIYLKIRYKRELIPYGPYLSMGAVIAMLYGNKIINLIFPVF
ncbi:MAG: prepilin peptidase [Candidatus Omnitrophota bacterium]